MFMGIEEIFNIEKEYTSIPDIEYPDIKEEKFEVISASDETYDSDASEILKTLKDEFDDIDDDFPLQYNRTSQESETTTTTTSDDMSSSENTQVLNMHCNKYDNK